MTAFGQETKQKTRKKQAVSREQAVTRSTPLPDPQSSVPVMVQSKDNAKGIVRTDVQRFTKSHMGLKPDGKMLLTTSNRQPETTVTYPEKPVWKTPDMKQSQDLLNQIKLQKRTGVKDPALRQEYLKLKVKQHLKKTDTNSRKKSSKGQ